MHEEDAVIDGAECNDEADEDVEREGGVCVVAIISLSADGTRI